MNLRTAARALGGEICGNRILAPGPGHSRADRSLSVWIEGDHVKVHSFASDPWQDCQAHVRQRLGLPPWQGDGHRERQLPTPKPCPVTKLPGDDEARRRDIARNILCETIDPRKSKLAMQYLEIERGLSNCIDDRLSWTLRFHPACPFGSERAPALVCAIRDAYKMMGACQMQGDLEEVETTLLRDINRIEAIQRIRLTPDGKKVGKGLTLGPLGDCGAVFLSSLWDCFYRNVACISEGVETGLSMRALGFQGCIALAGAGRFKSFVPPFHLTDIIISGENDAGPSETGWRAAGKRWAESGFNVDVWTPPEPHKDANDYIREGNL
jgi:putative DNA primase/helicase